MRKVKLILFIFLVCSLDISAQYKISYGYQNGVGAYSMSNLGAYKARISPTDLVNLPEGFFNEVGNYRFSTEPKTDAVKNYYIDFSQTNNNNINKYSFGCTTREHFQSYLLNTQAAEPGKVYSYVYSFYQSELYGSLGKHRKIPFEKVPKLSVTIGANIGAGFSVSAMSGSVISAEYITGVDRDIDDKVTRIYTQFGRTYVVGTPYVTLLFQTPIELSYDIGKHISLNATFTKNYFMLKPLKAVQGYDIGSAFGFNKESYEQTLFGFGVGYRFDKLPVRKK
jgi:hypothetical protein